MASSGDNPKGSVTSGAGAWTAVPLTHPGYLLSVRGCSALHAVGHFTASPALPTVTPPGQPKLSPDTAKCPLRNHCSGRMVRLCSLEPLGSLPSRGAPAGTPPSMEEAVALQHSTSWHLGPCLSVQAASCTPGTHCPSQTSDGQRPCLQTQHLFLPCQSGKGGISRRQLRSRTGRKHREQLLGSHGYQPRAALAG